MTTIILTIIGILLAAAAALMVIFYGGDAFNAGSVGARANTLQNAGTNVISAVQLYKAEGATNPTWTQLITGGQFLKEEPALDGIGAFAPATGLSATGQYVVTGVSNEVCARVNKNLGKPEAFVGKTGKMGCDNGALPAASDNEFFANT